VFKNSPSGPLPGCLAFFVAVSYAEGYLVRRLPFVFGFLTWNLLYRSHSPDDREPHPFSLPRLPLNRARHFRFNGSGVGSSEQRHKVKWYIVPRTVQYAVQYILKLLQ